MGLELVGMLIYCQQQESLVWGKIELTCLMSNIDYGTGEKWQFVGVFKNIQIA